MYWMLGKTVRYAVWLYGKGFTNVYEPRRIQSINRAVVNFVKANQHQKSFFN